MVPCTGAEEALGVEKPRRQEKRGKHEPGRRGSPGFRISIQKEDHVEAITVQNFRSLLEGYEPPCVSVYMTTDPHLPGGARDRIRLKNLLRTAVRELEQRYARSDAAALVEPLAEAFESSGARRAGAGLALLRSPEVAIRYALPVPVPELAVVASTFHTKPLLSYLARDRHFFVLALSERAARLYEASPLLAEEVSDVRLPSGMDETVGERKNSVPIAASTEGGATGEQCIVAGPTRSRTFARSGWRATSRRSTSTCARSCAAAVRRSSWRVSNRTTACTEA